MVLFTYFQQMFSIDELYLKDLSQASSSWNSRFLTEEQLSSVLLFERPEDEECASDVVLVNKALCTAYLMFLGRSQFERGQLILRGLQTILKESSSSNDVKKMANFEICRAQGIGFYKEGKYAAALKELNAAIASCPKVQAAFADGLSDTLVILSESYSRLAKTDDALHSARLAVDTAIERLERVQKSTKPQRSPGSIIAGPLLDPRMGTVVSYCNLAIHLEKSSLSNLSVEWYQRAYQVAIRFNLEDELASQLRKQIERLQPMAFEPANPLLSPPHSPQRRFFQNNDVVPDQDRVLDLDSDGPWFVPSKKAPPTRPSPAIADAYPAPPIYPIPSPSNISQLNPPLMDESVRMRPKSALPVLNRGKHGDYDEDDKGMDSSLERGVGGGVAYDGANSRGSPRNLEQDYFSDFARPKSAFSKLGTRYNETPKKISEAEEERRWHKPQPTTTTTTPQPAARHTTPHYHQLANIQPDLMHTPLMNQVLKMPEISQEKLAYFSTELSKGSGTKTPPFSSSVHRQSSHTPTGQAGHAILLLPAAYMEDSEVSVEKPRSRSKSKRDSAPVVESKYMQQVLKKDSGKPPNIPRPSSNRGKKGELSNQEGLVRSASQPGLLHKKDMSLTELQSSLTRSKTNKTLLSKTLSTTNLSIDPHSRAASSNDVTAKPAAPTAVQNWLMGIDEFGKSKVKRVSDMYLPYFKGLRVEAKYQVSRLGDRGKWYPGRIVRADFLSGLYDIEFENGDKEKNIFVDDIRIPEYASKLALVKATQARSKIKETVSKTSEKETNAALVRDQNMEDMHNAMVRLAAGVNQRADARKLERLTLKNGMVVKIQSLIRGALARIRLPKITAQIVRERELRQLERELRAKEEAIVRFSAQVFDEQVVIAGTGSLAGGLVEQASIGIQTNDEILWPLLSAVSLPVSDEAYVPTTTVLLKPNDDYELNPVEDTGISTQTMQFGTVTPPMVVTPIVSARELEAVETAAQPPVHVAEIGVGSDTSISSLPPVVERHVRDADIQASDPGLAVLTTSQVMMDQSLRIFQALETDQSLAMIQGMLESLKEQQRKLMEFENMNQGNIHNQLYTLQSQIIHQRDEFYHMKVKEDEKRQEMVGEIRDLIHRLEDDIKAQQEADREALLTAPSSPAQRHEPTEELSVSMPKESITEDFIQSVSSNDIPNFIRSMTFMEEQLRAIESSRAGVAVEQAPVSEPVPSLKTHTPPYEGDDVPPHIERYMSSHDFGDLLDSGRVSQNHSLVLSPDMSQVARESEVVTKPLIEPETIQQAHIELVAVEPAAELEPPVVVDEPVELVAAEQKPVEEAPSPEPKQELVAPALIETPTEQAPAEHIVIVQEPVTEEQQPVDPTPEDTDAQPANVAGDLEASLDISQEADNVLNEESLVFAEDSLIDSASAAPPYIEEAFPTVPPEPSPHSFENTLREVAFESPLSTARGRDIDEVEEEKVKESVDEKVEEKKESELVLSPSLPSANDLTSLLVSSPDKKTSTSEALMQLDISVVDIQHDKQALPANQELEELKSQFVELAPFAITLSALAHVSPMMYYKGDIVIPMESIGTVDKIKMIFLLPDIISENREGSPVLLKLHSVTSHNAGELAKYIQPQASQKAGSPTNQPITRASIIEILDAEESLSPSQPQPPAQPEPLAQSEQAAQQIQPADSVESEVLLEMSLTPTHLLAMFERLKWQSFANDNTECYMRGSLIRVDYILKLALDLWESYVLWMVQSIRIHVHLTKCMSGLIVGLKSADRTMTDEELQFRTRSFHLRQLALGEEEGEAAGDDLGIPENVQDDEEDFSKPPPLSKKEGHLVDKYMNALQVGRKMFVKSIKELYALENNFEEELENWEFDIRRYYHNSVEFGSMDELDAQTHTTSLPDDVSESQFAEIAFSSGLQGLTDRMHKFIAVRLLDYRSHSRSVASLPIDENTDNINVTEKDIHQAHRTESIQACKDRWGKKWQKGLHEVIHRFLQSVGLLELVYSKSNMLDATTSACTKIFEVAMHYIEDEDWVSYWHHRNNCVKLIHQSGLDKVLIAAEDVMYAPVYTDSQSVFYREGKSAKSVRTSMKSASGAQGSGRFGSTKLGSVVSSQIGDDELPDLPDGAEFVRVLREVTAHLT